MILEQKNNYILIDFPEKTMKEIVEECNNKVPTGKLLWSDWMKKEAFYTTEKTRPGKRWISNEIRHLNKDWNECKDLVEKEGGEMLNAAEYLYFLKCYIEHFKEIPDDYNWSWTSSRSSAGRLVYLGGVGGGGLDGSRGYPGISYSYRGVRFSRNALASGAEGGEPGADSLKPRDFNLEQAIRVCKDNGLEVFKRM